MRFITSAKPLVASALTLLSILLTTAAAHATTAAETVIFTFANSDFPSQLMQASDGNLYGTSPSGGSGHGYVFQLTPGGARTVIYNFANGADGGAPMASLIEGNDGNLYGANTTGGLGNGILFRMALSGAITPLHSFTAATDGSSAGALIENNAGDIFGAATVGGGSNAGTVFEYTHLGVFQLVHTFTGISPDGSLPNTQLLQASDGLIYGVTRRGGASGNGGSIFRFDPASFASFATIGSFPPTGQSDPNYNPAYGLTEGQDGALYGLTAEGGLGYGSIFKVVPGAVPTVTLDLYDLHNSSEGGLPASGLFLGGDGNFYGTTSSYGPGSIVPSGPPNGTFFQFIPSGSGTLTTLVGFSQPNGNANGTPLEAADGNFYGPAQWQMFKMVASPGVPAPVTLTATAATITLGQSFTVDWNVTNAFSQTTQNCWAHGGWSGSKALSGSQLVTPAATGTLNYALTCGGVESGWVMVVVNPVPVTQTATPVISPAGGTFYGPHDYTISDATPGATIYYTTNGTTPTTASPIWNGIPKVIDVTTTIKAIALASPLTVSNQAAATLTISNAYRTCAITYIDGFHANANLVLNHGATIVGNILDLTNGTQNQNTSAFALPRIPVAVFTTSFRFRFLNATPTSADGFTFTVQANSPNALGAPAGGLGYQGIAHSAALKFDLHNNAGEGSNSVGVYFGGAIPTLPSVDITSSGINLHSGDILLANVTWDSKFMTLDLTDTVTAKHFNHTFALPAASPFGVPTAYAGFTAGTGALTSTAQILQWTLESAGACGTN